MTTGICRILNMIVISVCLFLVSSGAAAEQYIQRIPVAHSGQKWIIDGDVHRIVIDERSLSITVEDGPYIVETPAGG